MREADFQQKVENVIKSGIADCAQISARYYHDLENGKRMPSLDVAERVAKALGVTLSELCIRIDNIGDNQ